MNMLQSNVCSPHASLITTGCVAQFMIHSPGKAQSWKTKYKRGNSLECGSKQIFPLATLPLKIPSGGKTYAKLLQKFIVSGTLEPKTNDFDLDIPDVDGDRDFGILSLSVRLGQQQVFSLCVATLLLAYGAAIAVGASSTILISKLITVLGHFSFAFLLLLCSQSVNVNDQASVTSFYMFIWKLFYAEYFLIPFVR